MAFRVNIWLSAIGYKVSESFGDFFYIFWRLNKNKTRNRESKFIFQCGWCNKKFLQKLNGSFYGCRSRAKCKKAAHVVWTFLMFPFILFLSSILRSVDLSTTTDSKQFQELLLERTKAFAAQTEALKSTNTDGKFSSLYSFSFYSHSPFCISSNCFYLFN